MKLETLEAMPAAQRAETLHQVAVAEVGSWPAARVLAVRDAMRAVNPPAAAQFENTAFEAGHPLELLAA